MPRHPELLLLVLSDFWPPCDRPSSLAASSAENNAPTVESSGPFDASVQFSADAGGAAMGSQGSFDLAAAAQWPVGSNHPRLRHPNPSPSSTSAALPLVQPQQSTGVLLLATSSKTPSKQTSAHLFGFPATPEPTGAWPSMPTGPLHCCARLPLFSLQSGVTSTVTHSMGFHQPSCAAWRAFQPDFSPTPLAAQG